MGLADYTYRLMPMVGDTTPHDEKGVSGNLSGGTIALVDRGGGNVAWRFSGGLATVALPSFTPVTNVDGNGATLALTLRVNNYGSTAFEFFVGVGDVTNGLKLGRDGSANTLRLRYGNAITAGSWASSTSVDMTLVLGLNCFASTNDIVEAYHSNTVAQAGGTAIAQALNQLWVNTPNTVELELVDAVFWPEQLSAVDKAALRDNGIRATLGTGSDTTPPTITSSATFSVPENTATVATLTANEAVTWAITGGVDAARFNLNSSTGALAFVTAPDFEAPTDSGNNNVYNLQVTATDLANNPSSAQAIAVTVTNVADTPGVLATNGVQLGAWVGSGAGLTFAYDVGVSYRAEVYAAALSLGNAIISEPLRTTGAGGAYPSNISSLSLTPGTAYEVVFTNQATGAKSAPYRLTAA